MHGFIKDALEDRDAVRSDLLSAQFETQISEFCQVPQCGKGPLYFIFLGSIGILSFSCALREGMLANLCKPFALFIARLFTACSVLH